jgi:hypothetical protein
MGDLVGQKVEELKRLMRGIDEAWTEEDYLEAALDALEEEARAAKDRVDEEARRETSAREGLTWSEIEKPHDLPDDEVPW